MSRNFLKYQGQRRALLTEDHGSFRNVSRIELSTNFMFKFQREKNKKTSELILPPLTKEFCS